MSKQEWELLLNMNNKAWIVHLDCTCAPLARQYPDLYLSTCICVQAAPIIRSLSSERKRQDSIRHQGQVGAWALRQRSSFAGVTSKIRNHTQKLRRVTATEPSAPQDTNILDSSSAGTSAVRFILRSPLFAFQNNNPAFVFQKQSVKNKCSWARMQNLTTHLLYTT